MNQEEKNKMTAMEAEIRDLRQALILATRNRTDTTSDIGVSMRTFYNLTQDIISHDDDDAFSLENDIYGHDVTVHFHGLYCNCYDGAPTYNILIEAIKECAGEYDE